jgi:cellulose synthase operon protein YhjQ
MKVISVISMKGGVGKSSVTANLASAFAAKLGGDQVVALDLDPQNALQWHFGLGDHEALGICHQAVANEGLYDIAYRKDGGVTCFPYGNPDESTRLHFESLLTSSSDWLRVRIEALSLGKDAIVLIDTPPGPSPYLTQALACADLALVVLLPDAASYATIPAMETYFDEVIPLNPNLRNAYVLNQVDETDMLGADIALTLKEHLGERLIPVTVSVDEAMREALALQQSLLVYDPHSQASQDIHALAAWLTSALER